MAGCHCWLAQQCQHTGGQATRGTHQLIANGFRVKQIVAIVKPYLAEKVLESLRLAPLEAISVREVKGYGRQKSYLDQYGDSEYSTAFLPKVEINLWVDDARSEEIIRKIVEVARTGRMGDGKIFVLPAKQATAIEF
jgi:nitrogen regulatory protein P-II 1